MTPLNKCEFCGGSKARATISYPDKGITRRICPACFLLAVNHLDAWAKYGEGKTGNHPLAEHRPRGPIPLGVPGTPEAIENQPPNEWVDVGFASEIPGGNMVLVLTDQPRTQMLMLDRKRVVP